MLKTVYYQQVESQGREIIEVSEDEADGDDCVCVEINSESGLMVASPIGYYHKYFEFKLSISEEVPPEVLAQALFRAIEPVCQVLDKRYL